MFTHQGLFKSLACPDRDTCNRPHCLYSHASNILPTKLPQFIVKAPPPITQAAIPIKRPVVRTTSPPTSEPPRKFQKVGTFQRPLAVPSASHSEVRSIYIYIYFFCLTLIYILVRRTNLESQCRSISGRCSRSTGLSFPLPCKSHPINLFG